MMAQHPHGPCHAPVSATGAVHCAGDPEACLAAIDDNEPRGHRDCVALPRAAVLSTARRWRDRISSNVDYLQALHDEYEWIPGRQHIRPSPVGIAAKKAWWDKMTQRYASVEDAVLMTVFRYTAAGDGATASPSLGDSALSGRLSVQRTLSGGLPDSRKVLRPNRFPYDLPAGTHHSVMWYAGNLVPSDAEVTADIAAHFARGVHGDDVDFVWYENPKRSIPSPELHHVHVFWRQRPPPRDEPSAAST